MIMPLKNKFSVWSPKSLDLGVSNFFNWLFFLTPKSKDLGLQPASNKLNYKTFMLCCAARHGSLYESVNIYNKVHIYTIAYARGSEKQKCIRAASVSEYFVNFHALLCPRHGSL